MNKSKLKGDNFERQCLHLAESMGLKGYRNRMSSAPTEAGVHISWDICIAGRYFEAKKRRDGFKRFRTWMEGNDGVIIGSNNQPALIVLKLEDFLKLL